MELLGDMGLVESLFFHLETVLVSVQDRCTVCAKRTIDIEIILDAPNGTQFGPFGDRDSQRKIDAWLAPNIP